MQAEKLGVQKVEATASGGKVKFTSSTQVDPLTLVRLVQLDSKRYGFGGPDELRFRFDTVGAHERIAFVEALLAKLAGPPPSPAGSRPASLKVPQAPAAKNQPAPTRPQSGIRNRYGK
jgi:hypothetical protein